MNQPKVLTLDIETTPMTAYIWGLKDQNIGLNQIVEDWSVMAFAAKWLGTSVKSVMYWDTFKLTERQVLDQVWELLNEADIVITQYGSGFDAPRLNARFIAHGMKPPSPYRHLDTYRIAKKSFDFTSNKLEYLTDKLCTKYKKLSHKKFPGMSLWTECLKGNRLAWDEMKRYNIHDVLSTEELYMKLRAWVPKSAPNVFQTNGVLCKVCGSPEMRRKGIEMTNRGPFQKYQCMNCGKWSQGEAVKGDK